MRKKTIVIILLICLLFDVQRVSAATAKHVNIENLYPGIGTIYDIDEKNDVVYYTDGVNNWSFYGVEDWMIGDTVLTIMHDNGTQNTVKDDIIISVRYSNIAF